MNGNTNFHNERQFPPVARGVSLGSLLAFLSVSFLLILSLSLVRPFLLSSVCRSACVCSPLSFCLSVLLSLCLSACPSLPPICSLISPSLSLSFFSCQSLCWLVCLYTSWFLSLCVCVVCLFVSLSLCSFLALSVFVCVVCLTVYSCGTERDTHRQNTQACGQQMDEETHTHTLAEGRDRERQRETER